MRTQNKCKINGVKGIQSRALPGKNPDFVQAGSDRHQATADQNQNLKQKRRKYRIKKKWKKQTFRFGTWNVRIGFQFVWKHRRFTGNGRKERSRRKTSRLVLHKRSVHDEYLYLCFIDYKKDFDKVKHNEIVHILDDLGLEERDLRDIQNVWLNRTAKGRTVDSETDEIRIEKGDRQGVEYSPDMLNWYSKCIMKHLDDEKGKSIGGKNIKKVRFTNDTALLASAKLLSRSS